MSAVEATKEMVVEAPETAEQEDSASAKGGGGKKEEPAKSPTKAKADKGKEDKAAKRKPAKEEDGEDEDEEAGKFGSYWDVSEAGGKRQRKSLEHYHPESSSKDKEDLVEKVISAGSGTPLRDISSVMDSITSHTIKKADKNDPLKRLSVLLFNKHGTPRETKENLLNFCGMVFEGQKQEENWCARVTKKTIAELKEILGCLHLERSGTHKELSDRMIEFLKRPTKGMADKGKAVAGAKKKSTATKKKASGSKSKPKKKASGAKKSSKKGDDEDDEDDDDEDDEDDEDEDEEEKPKPKPKPAKKSKGDDDDESDEPLVKKGGKDDKLAKAIVEICSKADLTVLTLRMVREKLEEDHKFDVVENKEKIKELVNDYIVQHTKDDA